MDNDTRAAYFAFFNEIGIIAQLSRALFDERLPDGLLVTHFSVLNHLVRVGDGSTPLDLANAFQVPKTTMSHTLAGLEKHGLVELRVNPKDARSKQVWLSEEGQRFRREAIDNLSPEFEDLADDIPPHLVRHLLRQLSRIRKVMDARRDGEPG